MFQGSEGRAQPAADPAADPPDAPPPEPPELPPIGSPARDRLDRDQAVMVSGLLAAAARRPPSWAGADARPSPACWCV